MFKIFSRFLLVITLFLLSKQQTCSVNNCPLLQGVCHNGICVCNKDYTTVDNEYFKGRGIQCNYPVKSKYIAFLLEFFFPFGVGHLYAENALLAIIKFGLFLFFLIVFCIELCLLNAKISKCLVFISFIFIIDILLWGILQIIDLGGYIFGYYKDGYGVPLQ